MVLFCLNYYADGCGCMRNKRVNNPFGWIWTTNVRHRASIWWMPNHLLAHKYFNWKNHCHHIIRFAADLKLTKIDECQLKRKTNSSNNDFYAKNSSRQMNNGVFCQFYIKYSSISPFDCIVQRIHQHLLCWVAIWCNAYNSNNE